MWFQLRPRQRVCCLWFVALSLYSFQGWGKGLNDLTPPPPPSETPEQDLAPPSVPGAEIDNADPTISEKPAEDMVKSELSKKIADKLFIGTSYGFAYVQSGSTNWRASGSSDVTVSYKLGMQVAGGDLAATFRYAPMDVAPHLDEEEPSEAYKGVVESYLFGSEWHLPLTDKLTAVATGELGVIVVHLDDIVGLVDSDAPDDTGGALVLGGGVDWGVMEKLSMGTRLRLGAGTLSSFQLSGNVTFAL
ncbi:MAG: hypothetical protein HRU09_05220 [Oligoflexales bacterium]|nr:hypothetical protein [Oligoflexales bacterium]